MSEREKLENRIKAMPTSELLHCLEQSKQYDDDISEILIRHIIDELETRKAG